MRKKLIAGNWKMYKTVAEAVDFVATLKGAVHKIAGEVDIVVCPPFTALAAVSAVLEDSTIDLGAQDMHHETDGAYTGEVSPLMLKDLRCRFVICGHSERRHYFQETDCLVNKKAMTAVKYNLVPIVCVGERLEDRKAGRQEEVVRTQFQGTFAGFTAEVMEKTVMAYEPVWAIGTGETATPGQAQQMQAFLRKLAARSFGEETARGLRILYGGSVRPDNARELTRQPDVDGLLVGGASLKAEAFIQIVHESLLAEVSEG